MRADRLVAVVLLLRHRGRMTADELAAELEVSARTIRRDIDALSTAGVPVYADRGRHGGFSLLPGFRTELTGLNHDEALALVTAASDRGDTLFGLGNPLAAAMRKVVDALPAEHRTRVHAASRRFLVEPGTDLLSRRPEAEEIADGVMPEVRRAVLGGHRLRIVYSAENAAPAPRVVDPIGLVTARGRTYLLATRSGEDRTYRVSRMLGAEALPDRAERPPRADLDRIWAERTARFLSTDHISVTVRVGRARRRELLDAVRAVRAEHSQDGDESCLEVTFEDLRHAVWAIWQLGVDAEVLAPEELRRALGERAAALADRYGD